jgi:diguanylate cyclase (GGDEF)-like protein
MNHSPSAQSARQLRVAALMLVLVIGALLALSLLPGLDAPPLWVAATAMCVTLGLALWLVRQANRTAALQAQADLLLTRQQEVFDHIECAILLWDARDRLVLSNEEFRTLYRSIAHALVPGATFESTLRSAVDQGLVPEARGCEEDWIRDRLQRHARPQSSMLRRMPDGRWRRIVEQRLSDGGLLSFSFDVTDQVEQAQSLEQARATAAQATQRLDEAIEALPVGFELWDADDRLIMANRTLGQLYPRIAPLLQPGIRFEELVRHNAAAGGLTIADDRLEAWIAERKAARHGGRPWTSSHQTGEGRWIRVHTQGTRDHGVVGVRIDVTELHEQQAAAEAARLAAERASGRLHDAIEALPDGFALFDAEDRLAVFNERYHEIYRDSAPVIAVGTRFEALLRYGIARGQYPQAEGREEAWIAERIHLHRHPGPPVLQELPGNRWLRIDERLTRDGGVAGVRTDVTELVRREQELTRLNLELDAANARLSQLSDTDGLTGIANRRKFDQRLAEEWARSSRHALPIALLLVDVDYFKRYNDRHGHPQGDTCLQRVAQLLGQTARRGGDLVARYGGEEFAVLLPYADREEAVRHAQRCLAAIDAAAIAHGDSPVAPHVTISVGVAVAGGTTRPPTAKALVQAADAALYDAKGAGRHRVMVAG